MQYIFSGNLRRALAAQRFDVSENYDHNRTNGINWSVRKKSKHENMPPGADSYFNTA